MLLVMIGNIETYFKIYHVYPANGFNKEKLKNLYFSKFVT